MPSGETVILTLKYAVLAVTVLLLASLVALARGNYRLHGRINFAFFTLTLIAVIGLEVLVQLSDREMFAYLFAQPEQRWFLYLHLCFSLPSAALMPVMLYTGLTRRRTLHLFLAGAFAILWTGTFITGIFFLPPALF